MYYYSARSREHARNGTNDDIGGMAGMSTSMARKSVIAREGFR
jgi:hypothetical protein